MERLNPKIDIIFKRIFGVEENKPLLINLINSIVSKEDQVKEITLLNPYNAADFKGDKLSILDIKAVGQTGKRYNIEIQITDEADYDKRALYYWAKLYTEQLKKSEDYGTLNKAIGIHILHFSSIATSSKYHNTFHITEKETGLPYFKDLELHTIELPKFSGSQSQELEDLLTKIKTSLDLWTAFLTRYNLLPKGPLPTPVNSTAVQKALEVLDVISLDEREREIYESHLKWMRIETNTLKKAHKDGHEEGLREGMEKGLQEGIEKGLQEGMEKRETEMVIAMLQSGLDLASIQKISNLPLEKIEAIQKNLSSK